ncbi:hypothetical protein QUF72_17345 [Desulfobacterales bacterium HSG2]|nr:hypothetical protein [Desulfobacterales bacterium HSG2]
MALLICSSGLTCHQTFQDEKSAERNLYHQRLFENYFDGKASARIASLVRTLLQPDEMNRQWVESAWKVVGKRARQQKFLIITDLGEAQRRGRGERGDTRRYQRTGAGDHRHQAGEHGRPGRTLSQALPGRSDSQPGGRRGGGSGRLPPLRQTDHGGSEGGSPKSVIIRKIQILNCR